MTSEGNYAIRDVARLKPALRPDLVFTPHRQGKETCMVIEDPLRAKFYRVGLAEYAFLSLLDGKKTVRDILGHLAANLPDGAFTQEQAVSICHWLIENGLAAISDSSLAGQLAQKAAGAEWNERLHRWNPVVARFPLLRPDRFFARLLPWCGWLHHPGSLAAGASLILVAAYQMISHWDRFVASSHAILAPGNWMWLLLCWIGLKTVHEASHAVVCKRYGGTVREAGILLILLAPIAYVDVTSCWRFRSKWQRMQTAAAGVYVELFVAALVAFVWIAAEPGALSNACHNIVVTASFMTLAVNLNPLMRFDGYYMLADLLEIPNLYSDGQQYLRYYARRYLLGARAAAPAWSRGRGRWIASYAVAALCWRICVCTCLVIAASALLHGAGIVLSVAAVGLWLGRPCCALMKYLSGGSGEIPNLRRFFATTTGLAILTAMILFAFPWPGYHHAPAVIEYAPLVMVRAGTNGFITQLQVSPGQLVEEGDLLAVLENDELRLQLRQLTLEIEQSELTCRMLKQAQHMTAYQAELKTLESLRAKQREQALQVEQLLIRSPCNGKILGRRLGTRLGTYVKEGTEILSIGQEERKEILVSVSQQDQLVFRDHVGQPVRVDLPYVRGFEAPLTRLDPRANSQPPHAGLGANLGGPLPVRKLDSPYDNRPGERGGYQLLAPRFVGKVALSARQGASLYSGQIGTVMLHRGEESIGGRLYDLVAHWIRRYARRYA